MRLDTATICQITGRKRPRGQADWFRQYLGAVVPYDRSGPILTASAYEALIAKAIGIGSTTAGANGAPAPEVRLRERNAG